MFYIVALLAVTWTCNQWFAGTDMKLTSSAMDSSGLWAPSPNSCFITNGGIFTSSYLTSSMHAGKNVIYVLYFLQSVVMIHCVMEEIAEVLYLPFWQGSIVMPTWIEYILQNAASAVPRLWFDNVYQPCRLQKMRMRVHDTWLAEAQTNRQQCAISQRPQPSYTNVYRQNFDWHMVLEVPTKKRSDNSCFQ